MTDAKKTVMPAYVVDKAEGASRLADLQKNLRAEREEAALKALPTPCYVVDEAKLLNNLPFAACAARKRCAYSAGTEMLFYVLPVSADGRIFGRHDGKRHL